MGIAYHELKFLQMVAATRGLGAVVTFARQNLNMSRSELRREYGDEPELPGNSEFIEDLLTHRMGATSVASIDRSNFEGATHIHDLNDAVTTMPQYDTVLDFGTSEHIFDIAQAFRNAIALCKVGGRIVHALPSNSECGHGFYQISPELLLSLYSEGNGFRNTEVYIAKIMDEKTWYRVVPDTAGGRITANSLSATYVLSVTEKVAEVDHLQVQQSDYVAAWNAGVATRQGPSRLKDKVRSMLKGSIAAGAATTVYRSLLAPTGLTPMNRNLRKVLIRDKARPAGR
ncbi:hypothetical protein [Sphingomonas albertensis]|uniref:Class I SAM-dependent methyltransferase n=1 Tax=Sphingomonas albertensis TaxID=2762591 RepID=A0ABR7AMX0_9SPHN|nr:hypothetical protein [Sphingomonas albertensis]MBC3941302.1 hypothetical protein [Sphingomonas albertensis]